MKDANDTLVEAPGLSLREAYAVIDGWTANELVGLRLPKEVLARTTDRAAAYGEDYAALIWNALTFRVRDHVRTFCQLPDVGVQLVAAVEYVEESLERGRDGWRPSNDGTEAVREFRGSLLKTAGRVSLASGLHLNGRPRDSASCGAPRRTNGDTGPRTSRRTRTTRCRSPGSSSSDDEPPSRRRGTAKPPAPHTPQNLNWARRAPNVVRFLRLLVSGDDHLPRLPGATLYEQAKPGAQPSSYVRCTACSGAGRIVAPGEACSRCRNYADEEKRTTWKPRHKPPNCRLCLACDGHGKRKRRAGEDKFDPYSRLTIAELRKDGEDPGFTLTVPDPGADFAWLERSRSKDRDGSYRELRKALEWLRSHYPGRHSLLMSWLDNPDVARDDGVLRSVRETVLMVTQVMPEPILVPGDA